MLDFLMIATRSPKPGVIEIYPKFVVLYKKSSDLMIRGGDFYAVWVEDRGLWSTEETDALRLIDQELDRYYKEHKKNFQGTVRVLHMWDAENGMIDSWHKYCQKRLRDSFETLDEKLIFSNDPTNKKDYASKRLSYPLEPGPITAYDKLMSTLYSEEERHKIEWAIGSIVSGESKKLQKFMVLYGASGTGKSTVLNIIQQLFEGYYSVFDAKALGSASSSFALESFRTNPLVAIQHDGDLSRIEDNTRLNSLVSHEWMTVNEKFKATYQNRFKCFLFMGTNKPVKITDAKSGLIRRLIDVTPTGEKLSSKEYKTIVKQIPFELGAIACHCRDIFLEDPGYYDDYIPTMMMGASNDFYNYVFDMIPIFSKEDGVTLKSAWEAYRVYCDETKVQYPLSQRNFREELKNYFQEYKDRYILEDGNRVRSYYKGFRFDRFDERITIPDREDKHEHHLKFEEIPSIFDRECAGCPAQLANTKETPTQKWDEVTSTLSDIDTSKVHYVKVPESHIVIDFDIPDPSGGKSLERNIEEASKWPATYAELSKSGKGVHLHYIYAGDVSKLSRVYDDHIEVKIFTGKSSLRRRLTKCNNLPIATINSGLPLKGESSMVNFEAVMNEKGIRTLIKRNLQKEIHPATKPSMDFIAKILEDAYNSGAHYDVSDMRNAVLAFGAASTNNSEYCIKLVQKMKFKSDDPSDPATSEKDMLIFYDVEVFPNLLLVNYKAQGEGKTVVRMINPKPHEIEELLKYNLVGFNCRRYDNHILYARMMGYSNEQIYQLSRKIVNAKKNANNDCFFSEAYNISYTDVYDYAATKQSLKKWEIDLGLHHQELGLPWDKPVPEEMWTKVAEYCDNDVIATEAVFNHTRGDFAARQILAAVTGMTVNDTTNSLSARLIFGKNRNPQDQFNWRDMGVETPGAINGTITEDGIVYGNFGDEYTLFDKDGRPIFPGYKYDHGKSIYRGEEVGEGGYVYAEPGIYTNVALLDVASMHPSSAIAEELFGPVYTKRFKELKDSRLAIKHKDWAKAKTMLDGALKPYIDQLESGKAWFTAEDLSFALKIVINSVYGLTAAKFKNPFRDPRNKDNIVAKRGALFMVNLKHEVQRRGFTVAHIKTDSIKIPNATPDIIQFVMDYGKMYGYDFEHEATYDRMCLVNDAVYIAKYKDGDWTATGTQFQIPYVFKKLFSKEDITFDDLCEAKSVSSALYLDSNENLPEDEHDYHFIGKVGLFCPIKPGAGGGILLREQVDSATGESKGYAAATGSKGYRWLEAEMVKNLGKQNDIDRSYYDKLVDEAVETINKYGDFEMFVSLDHVYDFPEEDELPWDEAS